MQSRPYRRYIYGCSNGENVLRWWLLRSSMQWVREVIVKESTNSQDSYAVAVKDNLPVKVLRAKVNFWCHAGNLSLNFASLRRALI